jgi:hypothetical protein
MKSFTAIIRWALALLAIPAGFLVFMLSVEVGLSQQAALPLAIALCSAYGYLLWRLGIISSAELNAPAYQHSPGAQRLVIIIIVGLSILLVLAMANSPRVQH